MKGIKIIFHENIYFRKTVEPLRFAMVLRSYHFCQLKYMICATSGLETVSLGVICIDAIHVRKERSDKTYRHNKRVKIVLRGYELSPGKTGNKD